MQLVLNPKVGILALLGFEAKTDREAVPLFQSVNVNQGLEIGHPLVLHA